MSHINSKIKFLALDLETTGLDTTKDEPIQLGMVLADSQRNVIDTYNTLIKPDKDISQLKDIVNYITGLKLEDLSDAPSIDEVLHEVSHRFEQPVVVVGHSVGFDIAILSRYLPDWSPEYVFDTFDRSQTLIHYPPSYALEVLWGQISDEYANTPFNHTDDSVRDHKDEIHHDALYDSYTSLALARHLLTKIDMLVQHYPRAGSLMCQHPLLGHLLTDTPAQSLPEQLPILTKPLVGDVSAQDNYQPIVDLRTIPNNKTRFSGHIPLVDMIRSAVASGPVIIATHTGQKLEIIKSILQRHGHHQIGYAKPEQHIDYADFKALLAGRELGSDIILFLLKYLSHHHQGLRVLQLLRDSERIIFHAIEKTTNRPEYDVVLCSHGGLYHLIEQDAYPDHTILYLDADRRHHSYNRYRSISLDPHRALTTLEIIRGVYETKQLIDQQDHSPLIHQLTEAINTGTMLIGVLGIHSSAMFRGRSSDSVELSPIEGLDGWRNVYQTWLQRDQTLETLMEYENLVHLPQVRQLREHTQQIMSQIITIHRSMRDSYVHFTYTTMHSYSDFSEFMQEFEGRHAIVTSHHRTTNKPLIPLPSDGYTPPMLDARPSIDQVIREIRSHDIHSSLTLGFLSGSKSSSQALFHKLTRLDELSDYQIIVDGVTGGVAKNTYKAQQPGPTIIIGGYYFFLNMLAKKVSINQLQLYTLGGSMKNLIIADMLYYGK